MTTTDTATIAVVGGFRWEPHHTFDDTTTQIDARLVGPDGNGRALDVWATDATDNPEIDDATRLRAHAAWDEGRVLATHTGGAMSLLVPARALTRPILTEALTRFVP